MKRMVLYFLIICLLITSFLLAACSQTSTAPATSTISSATQTTPLQTTSSQANWWDKFGTPQYGGTITYATGAQEFTYFDPDQGQMDWPWYEPMFEPDWRVGPDTWNLAGFFVPDQYWAGQLAESWEITNPQTITVIIRQGIHWQDKSPTNGRGFTAYDVQSHYDRLLGTGGGYTQPVAWVGGLAPNLGQVTATDNHTAVFKFKFASVQNFQTIADRNSINFIEAPEWVKQGDMQNWRNVTGTGAWILTDYIEGSSITSSKNPNYWGTDLRYPENKLPYADKFVRLYIPDSSTRIAALRTGKIDVLTALGWQQAQAMKASNPELVLLKVPQNSSGVAFRADTKPFTDIKVRKALNMSINRKEIASSYYGGNAQELPSGLITRQYTGYAYRYEDWSQELKDAYAYNPAAAKQLLSEAGYPDGFKTNVVASSMNDLQLLQVFKANFMDLGIDMEIKTMDPASYGAFVRSGKQDQMVADSLGFPGPPSRLIDHFYSKSPMNPARLNDSGYDSLHDKFLAAPDQKEASRLFMETDRYVLENHWFVLAGESFGFDAWQPYFKGYSGELLQLPGTTFATCWIDQSLKK